MAEGEADDDHHEDLRKGRGGRHPTLIGSTIAGIESLAGRPSDDDVLGLEHLRIGRSLSRELGMPSESSGGRRCPPGRVLYPICDPKSSYAAGRAY
jgi:hypothetical protein